MTSNIAGQNSINAELANAHQGVNALGGHEVTFPYVIFKIQDNIFALNSKYVLSIEETPPSTTEVSRTSYEVRGVTYYKEQAINLIDLRKVLGYMSQQDYIDGKIDLSSRIQEHLRIVDQLDNAIQIGSDITVTSDPHACTFGKWVDNYDTTLVSVKNQLERINITHERLHKSVAEIKSLLEMKRKDEALALFETVKNEYSPRIVDGLNALNAALHSEIRELSLIIQVGTKKVGLIVDSTESVEFVDEIQNLPHTVIGSEYVRRFGLRKKDGVIVLILEPSAFR